MAYDLRVQLRGTTVDSPLGPLLLAASEKGILRVAFAEEHDRALEELEDEFSSSVRPGGLDRECRQVEEYFEGRRKSFELYVDLSRTVGFSRRVLEETARVPFGSVSTYGEVAARAGNRRAARAAGNALRRNPVPIIVPCHRIVRSGGALGGYAGREDRKAQLIDLESRGR